MEVSQGIFIDSSGKRKVSKDVDLSGLSDFLKNKASGVDDALAVAIEGCCRKVHDDIQFDMAHTPRDMSRSYYKNNATKAHHPSLPGNPPAPDTDRLRGSINYEIHDSGKEVYGIVGSTLKAEEGDNSYENYAVYTEYGTSRMAPRPWLRPTMLKDNDFIRTEIAKAVRRTFTGGN